MARRQGGTEGAEIKSARVLYSRLGDGTSGGEGGGKGEGTKGEREKMETLGIRRPGKIPSTIRTFNRALRGEKEGGENRGWQR